jgi:hypothetical protein
MAGWYRSAAKTTCKSRPGSGVLSFVRRRAVRDQLGRCHPYRDAPSDLERLARIVSLPGCCVPSLSAMAPNIRGSVQHKNRVAGLERPTPHERVRALPRLARRYLVGDFESQMDPLPALYRLDPSRMLIQPPKVSIRQSLEAACRSLVRRRPRSAIAAWGIVPYIGTVWTGWGLTRRSAAAASRRR